MHRRSGRSYGSYKRGPSQAEPSSAEPRGIGSPPASGQGETMAVRVGINGFGRIGRNFLRSCLQRGADVEIVAINDLGDAKTMGHLLKHDSTYGTLDAEVDVREGAIAVAGNEIRMLSERDPSKL